MTEEESLTPAEQDARKQEIDAALERAEKRQKRVEARSKKAIEKVLKKDANETRMKAQKVRRKKRSRREKRHGAWEARKEEEDQAELEGYLAEDVQSDEETQPVELGPEIFVFRAGAANAGPRRSGREPKQTVFTNLDGGSVRQKYDVQERMDDGTRFEGEPATLEDGRVQLALCGHPYSWDITVLKKNHDGSFKVQFDFAPQGNEPFEPPTDIKFDRAWHQDATKKTKQEKPQSREEWHLCERFALSQNSGRVGELYRDDEGGLVFTVSPVTAEAAQEEDAHKALTVKLKKPSRSTRDREEKDIGQDWDMKDHGIDPDRRPENLPENFTASEVQNAMWEDDSETSSDEGDYESEWEASDEDDQDDEMEEEEDWQEAAAAFVAP